MLFFYFEKRQAQLGTIPKQASEDSNCDPILNDNAREILTPVRFKAIWFLN